MLRAGVSLLSTIPLVAAQAGLCTWCPHVVPTWPSTWALKDSTIAMPCNGSGLLRPEVLANFSISSIDWSNSKIAWANEHPMDSESALVQQAQANAAANPTKRTWVYRNIVIAYPWFPSVREKLVDPQYAGWFIPFGAPPLPNNSYHVPQCDNNYDPPLCTVFYHSQDQTPGYPTGDGNCAGPCDCGGVPCGFYLFNHANDTLRRWLIDDFVMGPTGVGHPAISGVYLDDHFSNFSDPTDAPDCASSPIGGPTEVNLHCIEDTGLTQADTSAMTAGYRGTMLELQQRLLQAEAFSWAYFAEMAGGAPSAHQCAGFFMEPSTADLYNRALMMGLKATNRTQDTTMRDIVTFLLIRGPYAWLGNPWQGCSNDPPLPLPEEVTLDFGVPEGNMTRVGHVFSREWSKATVAFDCDAYAASVTWK